MVARRAAVRQRRRVNATYLSSTSSSSSPDSSCSTKEKENDKADKETVAQRDSLQRLIELSKPEWNLIALSAGTLGISSSITLLFPFAAGQVIDYTVSSSSSSLSPPMLATGLFGLSAVAGGAVYIRALWLARAGNRIVARLKQRLYASMLQQERAYLDRQTTGDLLSRLTADAQLVQSALTTQAVAGLRALVMSTGSAGMLLYTSPTLAAISCCTLPPTFILTRHIGRRLQKQQEAVQKLQGDATSLAEQSLASIDTVKVSFLLACLCGMCWLRFKEMTLSLTHSLSIYT
jgi:ABC-type multidrug transport system fused ATPase/permease subunit